MRKQAQFEEWLQASLACKAEEIEPAADMWERVRCRISTMERGKGIMILAKKLGNYLFFWQPAWKKTMAIALCGLLLVGGSVFGISPQARAWATDTFGFIVFKVIRTGDGYSLVKLSSEQAAPEGGASFGFGKIGNAGEIPACEIPAKVPVRIKGTSGGKGTPRYATAAEAKAKVGFPVHLPEYLPAGYKLEFIAADKWEKTGKGFVNVMYRVPGEHMKTVDLMLTDEQGFLKGGDAVRKVKVKGETAYWCEYPIATVTAGDTGPKVKAGHMLKWEDKGLAYTLRDSGDLSLEEMVRIAESI
ncbi:MAG: DUF4367 domain-containing protein [Bacillota bacterium]